MEASQVGHLKQLPLSIEVSNNPPGNHDVLESFVFISHTDGMPSVVRAFSGDSHHVEEV